MKKDGNNGIRFESDREGEIAAEELALRDISWTNAAGEDDIARFPNEAARDWAFDRVIRELARRGLYRVAIVSGDRFAQARTVRKSDERSDGEVTVEMEDDGNFSVYLWSCSDRKRTPVVIAAGNVLLGSVVLGQSTKV